MTFRLSAAAEADLIDIYIKGAQEFGVTQAEVYQDKLDQALHLLGDNPKIARLREETNPSVRIHPVEAHIIVYLIDDQNIARILRVRHQRENWTADPVGTHNEQ